MGTGRIVSFHSYRGGTGKSNITANVACCAIDAGKRVAVLDTDLQSPGVHVIFGFRPDDLGTTLVDFLWGRAGIRETAYDITARAGSEGDGRGWLVPASLTTEAITRVVDEGYDVDRLNEHFDELVRELRLDHLLIDTHPGLNRETLLSTALSDTLVILLRPDQQDYYGTAVLSEVARQLELPRVLLVANKMFAGLDENTFRDRVRDAFGHELIGQIPLSEEMASLESRRLFVREHPDHPITHTLRAIAARILEP